MDELTDDAVFNFAGFVEIERNEGRDNSDDERSWPLLFLFPQIEQKLSKFSSRAF